MSTYQIDYSEPLKSGFVIPPGGFNGPGGASSNTSLRLYGRGALDWGESVNEDLVRLTESFSSATPPPNPAGGQVWVQVKLYHLTTPSSWYVYDPDGTTWAAITVTNVTVDPTTPGTLDQSYQYNTTTQTLWGYHKQEPAPAAWIKRAFSTSATPPTGLKPEQTMFVYNPYTSTWVPPQSVTVATAAPTSPVPGSLWYNTAGSGTLNVWDGVAWRAILTGGTPTTADLDMGNFKIVNLANPVSATHALNLQYADGRYLRTTGGTMTGNLDLGSTYRVTNMVNPTAPQDGATKSYVDAAIAGVNSGSSAQVFNNPAGSVTYNAGAIGIAAGKIYIALAAGTSAIPGGNWKQVWPATYG